MITIVKLMQLIIFFPKIVGRLGALIDNFLIFAPAIATFRHIWDCPNVGFALQRYKKCGKQF